MVLIPAGAFTMGSPATDEDSDEDERPQHTAAITRPFYMGKYEVTQAQWRAVMGSNPSHASFGNYGRGDDYPVYYVSWNDCQTFIGALNGMGQGTFRLPTEAEWEYACRAGSRTRYYWGDDLSYSDIDAYAWQYANNSPAGTKVIGQKLPNDFELFDMSGNVWELCSDLYDSEYYSTYPPADPQGPATGDDRIMRGGGWINPAQYCRSAYRYAYPPDARAYSIGLRLARGYP